MGELVQHVAVTRASTFTARHAPIAQRARPNEHEYPRVALPAARALQPQLLVGAADDPFEREAQRTAEAVTSMTASRSAFGTLPIAATLTPVTQRAVGKTEPPTKKDDDEKKRIQKLPSASGGSETMPPGTESRINTMQTGGEPLSASLRGSFEPRFGYDFGAVRTHSGGEAAGAASAIGARAFTVGDHIFFGSGEYRPETPSGQRLIAHELTHTVQQQSGAARAARIQRASLWDIVSDPKAAALAQVTKWADELPPYELLTVLLGRNPITDRPVERSARNLLHAVMKLVPDGMAIFDDLEKDKTLEKLTAWFNAEVAKLDLTWEGIKGLFKSAWDAIHLSDFIPPTKAWEKVKTIFGPPLVRIANFAVAVGAKIFEFVKKVALDKIGAWAKQQRGYTLLTFVLGKDPVTGDEVKRTAKGFVFAVLDLVPGGDKIKENLEKSKTIERTVVWLEVEIAKLDLTWEMIKGLFKKAWDAFKIVDLLNPIGLLIKMAEIFGAPLGRLLRFLGAVAKKVLEFIFEGAMMIAGPIGEQIVRIVHKIGDAFNKIVEDPVAFLNNLVSAVKLGFQQFGKNIWEHLKTGLIGWLVGALEGAGIVLPKVWDLKGILDLVLQILGITYAKMRAKLVKVIGEERVAMLERVFQFIKTLVTEGPAAAWQQIVEAIGSLWDMVIGGIKDWAISKIVTAAITKLATMFNPVGAIIQSIIAIYNTVAFFIERIKQILAMVEAIVDSIANIAAGKLAAAANYVEQAMARTIPVILGFLARLIGLGDVSGAIKKVITAIQEKVDKAIDAVIAWLVDKAKALFGGGKAGDKAAAAGAIADMAVEGQEPHTLTVKEQGGEFVLVIHSAEEQLGAFLDAAENNPRFSSKRKQKYLGKAKTHLAAVQTHLKAVKKATDEAGEKKARADLLEAEKGLAASIKGLLAGVDMGKLRDKYLLEGVVKTYATLPKPKSDQLTPDHQPQASLVTLVANTKVEGRKLFAGLGIQGIAANRAAAGVAINLHFKRHIEGRTYGQSVPSSIETQIGEIARGGSLSEKTKRERIMTIVEGQLKADVKAMKDVAKTHAGQAWTDIDEVIKASKDDDEQATTDDAKALKKEIADRIDAGEDAVKAQDLARWTA